MVEFVTFDDIAEASESAVPLKTLKGKHVKVRALDPVELMDYMDAAKDIEKDDSASTKDFYIMVREVVCKGLVSPAVDAESVKKVPGKVLMEMFHAILGMSGAGGEAAQEAEAFRAEPSGADGSPTVG